MKNMNQYLTGTVIKELREKCGMTQAQLARRLSISDKTVSKWETGRGFPDISLLESIADAFKVSVAELLSGRAVSNTNVSANMLKCRFHVCPVCGNVIPSVGSALISCHGVILPELDSEAADGEHSVDISIVEDEYFVHIEHPMTKAHYISFMAAVSPDRLQLVKLYPEGNAETRFKINGVHTLYYYCNRDGLFAVNPRAAI